MIENNCHRKTKAVFFQNIFSDKDLPNEPFKISFFSKQDFFTTQNPKSLRLIFSPLEKFLRKNLVVRITI